MGCGEEDCRVKKSIFKTSHPGHVLSAWFMTVDADLEHLAWSTIFLFPSLPHSHVLWEEVFMHSPPLREGGYAICPPMVEYLHHLFGILLHGRYVFSFINLFCHLLNYYGFMDTYYINIHYYFNLLLTLFWLWSLQVWKDF